MTKNTSIAFALLSGVFAYLPNAATAQEKLDSVLVQGRATLGEADSSAEGIVKADRLAQRPLLRPAELLEAMPGMVVTQHSGDGKANQYFLRGFNLDHGSDFGTQLEGMPINMPSHAHGQGYMDLNFLIPELVTSLSYRKGAYAAQDGDFGTTGSASINYAHELNQTSAQLATGSFSYTRMLALGGQQFEQWQTLGAVELSRYDGPWEQAEQVRRRNAVLRLSTGDSSNGYGIMLMAYDAQWLATEHVPERAIVNGEIGRFGNLIANDGGRTHRYSLSAQWARSTSSSEIKANAYFIDYGLNYFASPSGYISGPQGDQHEQADERQIWGAHLQQSMALGASEATWGAQWRHDRITELGLHNTVDRQRTHTVSNDLANLNSWALYAQLRTPWQPWLRSVMGLRWEQQSANVQAIGGQFNLGNTGSAKAQQFSPKLGLAIRATPKLELYFNWGRGLRSNDARAATGTINPQDGSSREGVPMLVSSASTELGLRAMPTPNWSSSLTLWQSKLASELVFVGDSGVTEPRGASKRLGLEWSNDFAPATWLHIDADLALSRAQFDAAENGGTEVPNAIPFSASLAANVTPNDAWTAGLRLRYLGSYALEETGTHRSSSLLTANLKLGYNISQHWQASLDVLNLFNKVGNDIEYWGAACSRNDGPACNDGAGIEGRLIHPIEPRSLRLSLRATF